MARAALMDPSPTLGEAGQGLPSSCPSHLHPLLVEVLERGRILVAILDNARTVCWSNQAFSQGLLGGRAVEGVPFTDLLDADSARLLAHLGPLQPEDQMVLDLRHPTPSGHRSVKYQLFSLAGGLTGFLGSDQTEEIELVAQMSALVEDLNREVDHRTALSRELERMATTDFLTGVSNRRDFDKVIQDEWRRMKRYQSHFALLLLDLDHFKRVNDRFGHQAGDEVLKRVAEALQNEVRAEDVVARYGGEEFAVIALGASAEKARDLGERLRKRVQAASWPAGIEGLTITIGVAATHGLKPDDPLSRLIGAADEALYRGKQKGRNRVELEAPRS
jgi:diguanylate cyclase (GGDEF)-like protein